MNVARYRTWAFHHSMVTKQLFTVHSFFIPSLWWGDTKPLRIKRERGKMKKMIKGEEGKNYEKMNFKLLKGGRIN